MIFLEDNEINFSRKKFIYAVKKIFYDESIDNI